MKVDSGYSRIYWTIVDQRIPPPVSSEDGDDAAYDGGISHGNIQTMEEIQTMGPMERIDPFKRDARKREYNCLSSSKDTQSRELVEKSESVQKATKKRDHSCLSAPKSLRNSYRKRPKLEAFSEVQQYDIFDEDDTKTISQIFPKIKLSGVIAGLDTLFHPLL